MAFKRKASGAFVDVANIYRRSGGSWVLCSNVYRRSGGAWTKVWPSTPPISISGATSYFSSGTVGGFPRNKNATSALSVSGGTGTYTYAWVRTYLDGTNAPNASSTTVLNPTISASVPVNETNTSIWRLTVTSGSATATYDITVYLSN